MDIVINFHKYVHIFIKRDCCRMKNSVAVLFLYIMHQSTEKLR